MMELRNNITYSFSYWKNSLFKYNKDFVQIKKMFGLAKYKRSKSHLCKGNFFLAFFLLQ